MVGKCCRYAGALSFLLDAVASAVQTGIPPVGSQWDSLPRAHTLLISGYLHVGSIQADLARRLADRFGTGDVLGVLSLSCRRAGAGLDAVL